MKLEPNTTVSHFKILSSIGKGGMGEVYLAQDTELDRKVAIKFLSEELGKDEEKVNRFVQEAKASSALNHPNILTVYEIGNWEDTRYIATEYIEGETLRDVLKRKEPVPLNRVLKIGIQVAEALSAAHEAGIAHRDIKPENIMVRRDGYVKVLDFGLAKLVEKQSKDGDISLEGETKALVKTNPGVVMGTANYMSPEQAQGKETDARTDIWSLGVVLYEMLAGHIPFEGKTINHTIVSILETEPKLLENVPDELQRIVRKTLAKEKDSRYQTAKDLLIDLKNLRRDLDIQGELERSVIPNVEQQTIPVQSGETATAEGAQSTQNLTTASSLEYAVIQAKSHKLATSMIAVLVIGVIATASYFAFFGRSMGTIDSIAVMPFVNESGDPEVDYLSDGMTEDLISSLTEIPDLSVKARSTVFYYKGKNMLPRQIGEELEVEAVLLGRVVQRGDGLKLNLELVDTATLDAIWSKSYDRKLDELVNLQSEIARDVSARLRSGLTTEEQQEVTRANTANSTAHQLYLKGRFYWNKRNLDGFEKAEEYFQQAIKADPGYALAYSGLADTYTLRPYYGNFRPKEYFLKARQAVEKALELDPELAEAYASLGQLSAYEYDFAAAERAYKKAIDLDPRYAGARQWYSETLMYTGRIEEAEKQIDIALDLEPLSMIINHAKGYVFEAADRTDAAIAQGEKTLELFPNFAMAHANLHRQYTAKGNFEKAAEHSIRELELLDTEPERIEKIKAAYEKDGWKGLLTARLELDLNARNRVLEEDSTAFAMASYVAWAYAALGDKEKTLEYLNIAYEQGEPQLVDIGIDYYFDFLKGDPEFEVLKRKVGLPAGK